MIKKGKDALREFENTIEEGEETDPLRLVLKIREVLEKRGMTQKDLADLTGIRPAAISALARGFVDRITIDHIERIANALNITNINELISLELESEIWNMSNVKQQKEYLSNKDIDE